MDVYSGPFVLTPEVLVRVEECAAIGLSLPQIAASVGMDPRQLSRAIQRYPELERAWGRGNSKGVEAVANALFRNATEKNDTTAQIFFLKNRAPNEWEEVQKRILWQSKDDPQNMQSLDDFYEDLPQLDDPHTLEGELVERKSDTKPES